MNLLLRPLPVLSASELTVSLKHCPVRTCTTRLMCDFKKSPRHTLRGSMPPATMQTVFVSAFQNAEDAETFNRTYLLLFVTGWFYQSCALAIPTSQFLLFSVGLSVRLLP